jgi:hypothetical protein
MARSLLIVAFCLYLAAFAFATSESEFEVESVRALLWISTAGDSTDRHSKEAPYPLDTAFSATRSVAQLTY